MLSQRSRTFHVGFPANIPICPTVHVTQHARVANQKTLDCQYTRVLRRRRRRKNLTHTHTPGSTTTSQHLRQTFSFSWQSALDSHTKSQWPLNDSGSKQAADCTTDKSTTAAVHFPHTRSAGKDRTRVFAIRKIRQKRAKTIPKSRAHAISDSVKITPRLGFHRTPPQLHPSQSAP